MQYIFISGKPDPDRTRNSKSFLKLTNRKIDGRKEKKRKRNDGGFFSYAIM